MIEETTEAEQMTDNHWERLGKVLVRYGYWDSVFTLEQIRGTHGPSDPAFQVAVAILGWLKRRANRNVQEVLYKILRERAECEREKQDQAKIAAAQDEKTKRYNEMLSRLEKIDLQGDLADDFEIPLVTQRLFDGLNEQPGPGQELPANEDHNGHKV